MNNSLSVTEQNAILLGMMSSILCGHLNIPVNDETVSAITVAVMCKLAMWYKDHDKVFDPQNILLEEDAVAETFATIHTDILMADIAEQTGIGMEK